MTLLTKTPLQESDVLTDQPEARIKSIEADELVINMSSSVHHPSPMPDNLKLQNRPGSPRLNELFDQTLEHQSNSNDIKCKWIDTKTVEVEGLSKLKLHSLILKAEELGKNITYTRTYSVKISD